MKYSISILACLFTLSLSAQKKTGSFNETITFMNASRTLSYYVPANYDSTKAYKLMVCLHGLGDNSSNFRSALVGNGWPSSLPDYIFVCPEGYNVNADFFQPAGGEEIINQAIGLTTKNYHIDPAWIVLEGFSLGGRAALRFGLQNPSKFKGLLLNTPAIQGVKEGLNIGLGKYTFDYSHASKIPVYITRGGTDIAYAAPVDTMFRKLVLNDGPAVEFVFPAMGHNVPPIAQIKNFESFFSTPGSTGPDADVIDITTRSVACSNNVSGTILVRNAGNSSISSIQFESNIDGPTFSIPWTGTLKPFEHVFVPFSLAVPTFGTHDLTITVKTINGSSTDSFTARNIAKTVFNNFTSAMPVPFTEDFDGPVVTPKNWANISSGDFWAEWLLDSTVKSSGSASIGAVNTILFFDNIGRRNEMMSPPINLSGVTHPELRFNEAYNYQHYFPPVLTIDTVFADTLQVLISNDCGATWKSVYKRGGKELSTFDTPIENPTTAGELFINPAADNWRTEIVDLSSFNPTGETLIKFSYISAGGGAIYLDKMRIGAATGIAVNKTDEPFNIYPNPAHDHVVIDAAGQEIKSVYVYDLSGRTVISDIVPIAGMKNLNISALPGGLYTVQVNTGDGVLFRKMAVK